MEEEEEWEIEEPAPLVLEMEPVNSRWADEDVDEKEDEPTPVPVSKPPAEKPPKKIVAKANGKKGKTAEVVKEEALDPVAEKLRQQRLVEEADYKNTIELFGEKSGDDKSLDIFIPKSSDAKEVASSVTAILNEKLKAEKEVNAGKKKTGAKKKQLIVDKPDDDAGVSNLDSSYEDSDFM